MQNRQSFCCSDNQFTAYYTGIMLNAFDFLLCPKLCWNNGHTRIRYSPKTQINAARYPTRTDIYLNATIRATRED